MLDPTELFPEIPNLYEFPSVHADMLFDNKRVSRYAEAIARTVKAGDVVADIGTGTGLLAFMCLRAGASKVHAIDRSPAIRWARKLADHHGFADKIAFYSADSRHVHLPEKVNVIVSELIGHVAFEEGMAESLFDARKRFLLPDGKIIPRSVSLRGAIVNERHVYSDCIECWQEIEGIDYSILRDEAIKSCYLTAISDRDLMSEPTTFIHTDFCGDPTLALDGTRSFEVLRPGQVNGVALWFDAQLAPSVTLSSSPWARTHWRQCFAPIPQPLAVEAGEHVRVDLRMGLGPDLADVFDFALDVKKELQYGQTSKTDKVIAS